MLYTENLPNIVLYGWGSVLLNIYYRMYWPLVFIFVFSSCSHIIHFEAILARPTCRTFTFLASYQCNRSSRLYPLAKVSTPPVYISALSSHSPLFTASAYQPRELWYACVQAWLWERCPWAGSPPTWCPTRSPWCTRRPTPSSPYRTSSEAQVPCTCIRPGSFGMMN